MRFRLDGVRRLLATALVALVGLSSMADCLAKDEKKSTPSFGSFGGSSTTSTATKKSEPAAAAPAAPRPTAPAPQQQRSAAPQLESSPGKTSAMATATTPSFGQFGGPKKTEQAPARSDGVVSSPPVGEATAMARKGSATQSALERAAAQAEALRTLDARRSVAVSGTATAATSGGTGRDARLAGAGAGAGSVNAGVVDRHDEVRGPAAAWPAPAPGVAYSDRSSGLGDVATGALIERAMRPRPTIVVRESAPTVDWGTQPMSGSYSAGGAPLVPSVPVVQTPPVSPTSDQDKVVSAAVPNGEGFPWGEVFGIGALGFLAVLVVVWMMQARPAQKKRYSL